jgi:hypothetical protein
LSQITLTVLSFFGHKKSEHGLEAKDKRETATAHGNGIRPRVDTKRNSNSFRGQKYKQARYITSGGQSPQITTIETARKYRGKRKPIKLRKFEEGEQKAAKQMAEAPTPSKIESARKWIVDHKLRAVGNDLVPFPADSISSAWI